MPRYYFHLAHPSERILDADGLELACDAAVTLEATQAVRELLEEEKEESWNGWSLQVVDEAGRVVVSMGLDESLR